MLKEFKEFAMKGNLIDIGIGFVMGAAFNKVVSSFTGGIVSPLIGLIFQSDFKDLKYVITEGKPNTEGVIEGEVAVMWGEFLTNLIDLFDYKKLYKLYKKMVKIRTVDDMEIEKYKI